MIPQIIAILDAKIILLEELALTTWGGHVASANAKPHFFFFVCVLFLFFLDPFRNGHSSEVVALVDPRLELLSIGSCERQSMCIGSVRCPLGRVCVCADNKYTLERIGSELIHY